ncbi:hypothetical protein GCM10009609_03680 [Pseudonocardia aurantiaca]
MHAGHRDPAGGGRGDGGPSAVRRRRWRREPVHARGRYDAQSHRAIRVVRLGAAWGAVARQDLPFSTSDLVAMSRSRQRGLGIPQWRSGFATTAAVIEP